MADAPAALASCQEEVVRLRDQVARFSADQEQAAEQVVHLESKFKELFQESQRARDSANASQEKFLLAGMSSRLFGSNYLLL